MDTRIEIEIALEEPGHAMELADFPVDRIELCSNLNEGGLTPTVAQARLVCEGSGIPVYAMIRPRAGGFVYSDIEKYWMLHEVDQLARSGVAGVVFGALDPVGALDREFVAELVEKAQGYGLGTTFHRAMDACTRSDEAFEQLIAIGVERVLTSGGAATVAQGMDQLATWQRNFGDRITIQAGSGVSAAQVRALWEAGIRAFHMTARKFAEGVIETDADARNLALGFAGRWELDRTKIEHLAAALREKGG
ncbi:MAG: hypothetical protein RL754_1266 [Bacteroidota bacterium]